MAGYVEGYYDGCFTFEGAIAGAEIREMGRRLGLPSERLSKGVDIYYALNIPRFEDFDWGGMASDSTDKFITYIPGKPPQYHIEKFVKLFKGSGIPITATDIGVLKAQLHSLMCSSRLVKVVPKIQHKENLYYPAGSSFAVQFILKTKLQCFLGASIPPYGTFRL